MEEAAFLLHLMLGTVLQKLGRRLCLTGAMAPADALGGGDGTANLHGALRVSERAACCHD